MTIAADSSESPAKGLRSSLLEKLCEWLERTEQEEAALQCAFAREFFSKVPLQLIANRSTADLAAVTRGAFHFLQSARTDRIDVQVLNPEDEGWSAPVTIIRAEVADRPFVVDTIREYLSSENLPIEQYVYRVIGVDRDSSGRVVAITDPAESSPRSLVHCEVPRIPDAERREEIRAGVERHLADVVAATDDFGPMLDALDDTIRLVRHYARQHPDRATEFREVEEFLRWLGEDNFVLLGYRAYEIDTDGEAVLRVEPGTGLGILGREDRSTWHTGIPLSKLPDQLRRRVVEGPLLITSKTNAESTVHRRARMDYIGVKKLSESGEVVGERRFLGLFTSKAYAEHADAIPVLRRKLEGILATSGAAPGSHDYKEIITIFNSIPKEDLFQASEAELESEIQTVLNHLFSDEVQVACRPDPFGRGVSVLVILPRGRFSGDVRHQIEQLLMQRFGGSILNYHLAMSAGDQARLHFYVSAPEEDAGDVDPDLLTRDIRQLVRSWEDRLIEELEKRVSEAEARRLGALYGPAFSEEYRAANLPEVAVQDIEELERMLAEDSRVAITLREPRGRGRAETYRDVTVLKLYLSGEQLILSDFMPILDNAGLRVIEVVPFALAGEGLPPLMIYSFAVQQPDGTPVPVELRELLTDTLLAVRRRDTPNDPFNALVVHCGLRWREVDIIRMYANYAFQARLIPTRYGPARALARAPELARLVIRLFHTRFAGPERADEARLDAVRRAIVEALDAVATLADDRAIRRIVSLVEATTRTNYFRGGGANPTVLSGGVPYISIKVRSGEIEELKRDRLLFEIFVYSARMEGIHLRGAPVSRGGIRWSDRLDDFRTEVLGLVQTQIVKNAVIVPGGSKGGFVTKRVLPDRDAMMREAAEQYQTLMRGLLDLTDNIVAGAIVPPAGVVRYDRDDPYLVVAADKGTAHLSDVANGVAAEYGFWLGDAFASGGSHGYDHKKEGITARGAWECVKRHFREMGKDIQAEPFTVAGIGDMSGDVFGNGMLLSRQIRLVAAFDHRHIFIDPDPDPEVSYGERERLFRLERSSWDDYDRGKLSPGGMIVPRGSKEVELTPEARVALGLGDEVDRLDGEALIRAVLQAPVELLWNGGIGTYVKDASETNAEVGDLGNDPVRIDAQQLRCRVIGEGGNLGMTQRARIVFALGGGRLDTDALDNSAGVDMSDHEVNLKILFAPLVAEGAMSVDERNELLRSMTDEVSALVLQDNVSQSLAVSLDEARSREALMDFTDLIGALEREGLLERSSEGIPRADELKKRDEEGIGLTRPTLCVLLAYAKLDAHAELLASRLPDDPTTEPYLVSYFPPEAVAAAGADRLREHRLRREIIATELVNDLVDLMGASFLHRVARDTGRSIASVATAWYIASRISGAAEIRAELGRLETTYPSQTVYRWLFGLARVLERTTRWALANVEPDASIDAVMGDLGNGLDRLRSEFGRIVQGEDRVLFEERLAELSELEIEGAFADRLITLRFLPQLLDILRIAHEAEMDPTETGEAYYLVSARLGVGWIQHLLRVTPSDDLWEKRLAQSLISDVQRAQRTIGRQVLQGRTDGEPLGNVLTRFEANHAREFEQYRELVEELRSAEQPPFAACAVAIRSLVELSER